MPTKRVKLVKNLRRMVAQFPPENFAPWKKPNNSLQQVIDKQAKTEYAEQLMDVQESMLESYVERIKRQIKVVD